MTPSAAPHLLVGLRKVRQCRFKGAIEPLGLGSPDECLLGPSAATKLYTAGMARSVLGAALFLTFATWVALLTRIVSDATNHSGIDPLLGVIPFLILGSLSWLTRTPKRMGLRTGVTAYALLSILAVVGLDRANILVQYDRWAGRGMPDRPCTGFAGHLWACKP